MKCFLRTGSLLLLLPPCFSFLLTQKTLLLPPSRIICSERSHCLPQSTRDFSLDLVPLSYFLDEVHFLSSSESNRLCIGKNGEVRSMESREKDNPYLLCLMEEDDLSQVSRLIVDAFGVESIKLSPELNDFEKAVVGPLVSLWNAYAKSFSFYEVFSGLRSRTGERLLQPNVKPPRLNDEHVASDATSSLVLVVARQDFPRMDSRLDTIATVELRLQPSDGKIPFSQPWLDGVERKMGSFSGMQIRTVDEDLQPYLSNLCVAESARGRSIGRSLVRCVERIARDTWGYSKMYLHVDLTNTAACALYRSEGYRDIGIRWNPFWAGKAAEIGYFAKEL